MKMTLTKDELCEALRATYQAPRGYRVESIDINDYRSSSDYCVIELTNGPEALEAAPPPLPSIAEIDRGLA